MTVQDRCGQSNALSPVLHFYLPMIAGNGAWGVIGRSSAAYFKNLEVFILNNIEESVKGKMVPIWEKYMLTVDEAVQYFGIGEKKIRMLISENTDTDYCFTVQVGNKSLINRHKFEEFLNQTTSL